MKPALYEAMAGLGSYVPEHLPVARSTDLEKRLSWSGHSENMDGFAWDNTKRGFGVVLAAFAFICAPGWISLVLTAPAYAAGTFVPDVLLDSECDKIRGAVDKELPGFAENLAILTGAGLSLNLALIEAAAEVPDILGRYLTRAVNEIRLGIPRKTALEEAAAATPSENFKRLSGLIIDTERFGTPVAAELTRMAAELREKRMAAMREEAQKLPVKMLFPLVFMILPSFILLTAGPLLLSMT